MSSEPVDPKLVEYIASRRHECALSGPCSDNGDGCTCSAVELSERQQRRDSQTPTLQASDLDVEAADGWLLIKRGLYWRPNAQGYTGIREHAGIYSDEDSAARVEHSDGEVTRIRFEDAPEVASATFDDIARDYWRARAETAEAQLAAAEREKDEAEAAIYGRHQRGFVMRPLIDPPSLPDAIRQLKADHAANLAAANKQIEAAEYLVSRLDAVHRGIPVRDLDEAWSAYDAARTALSHEAHNG